MSRRRSVGARRAVDRPDGIGAEGVVDEEVPSAALAPAMDLHAVMVDLDRPAVPAPAGDPPLRARHREIAGDGDVVGDDIHVGPEIDIGGHGRPDRIGAARDRGAAMDIVDLHDRGLGMVEGGRRLDILRVGDARQP